MVEIEKYLYIKKMYNTSKTLCTVEEVVHIFSIFQCQIVFYI